MASLKKFASILASVAIVAVFLLGEGPAAAETKAAAPDAKAIEKIIRDYLLKHPEIISEALETHRRNVAAQEELALRQTIKEKRNEIRNDPGSVVGGNLSGDVTVVEFFDYQCGVCKRVHPLVNQLVKEDGKIRRVYKEWPILGAQSIFAARAAIASRKQGDHKYMDFHNQMMQARKPLTPDNVLKIAEKAGLDSARLKRDMGSSDIDEVIRRNYELARELKLNGTPSFLIGDTLLRGARDLDTMLELVRDARKES